MVPTKYVLTYCICSIVWIEFACYKLDKGQDKLHFWVFGALVDFSSNIDFQSLITIN